MKDTRNPLNIPTVDEYARMDYDAGKMDARGVAEFLAQCDGGPWTCAEALARINRKPKPGENLWPGYAFCRG